MKFRLRADASQPCSTNKRLISILFVAAIFRLENVTEPFIDDHAWRESSVAMMAENFYRKGLNIFYPEVNWVGPGPGYQGREFQTISYIAALLYIPFGQQDWIGRSIALSFGLLGIVALYQLISRVWDEARACIAAALMAVLPGVIGIERAFLPDPVMVALVTTSLWLLVVYLQTDQPRYLILAVTIGTWGNLTKIPGLIVGLPMLYAICSIFHGRNGGNLSRIATLTISGFLSIVPVVVYYLWALHLSYTYPPHHFAGEGNWVWDQGFTAWVQQHYFLPRLWEPIVRIWTQPVIILSCVGFIVVFFWKTPTEQASKKKETHCFKTLPLLFHWWIVAGVVYYLLGAFELIQNPTNFHIITPAIVALSSQAIMTLAALVSKISRLPTLVVPLAATFVVCIGIWEQRLSRPRTSAIHQSHQLGLALRAVSHKDDLVVTVGNYIGCPVAIYYSGRRGWTFPPFGEINDWDQVPKDLEAIALFEKLRTHGAAWFGIVKDRQDGLWKERPRFAEHLEQNCDLSAPNAGSLICRIRRREE